MTAIRFTLVFLMAAVLAGPALAQGQKDNDPQETYKAAVFLLKQSMEVQRNGEHNVLLRALRHLGDPQLAPLFSELIESPYPPFKIHGVLGLAECDPKKHVDLARVAAIKDPAEQAQVLSAAMDGDLLSEEQVRQVLDWPGLDVAIKVLVGAQLVSKGKFDKPAILSEASESDNIARRYLAYLLLAQIGDAEAYTRLNELHASKEANRDDVRAMLLRTALRYELSKIGPFAMRVASEVEAPRRLRMEALKAALRFNAPGAADLWKQQFTSSGDLAQRTRLSLLALQLSPWIDASLFEPMITADDELISQLGRTGQAVAEKRDVIAAMRKLTTANYSLANAWALGYARYNATDDVAVAIYKSLIEAYRSGPERGKAQGLDDAVIATELLYQRDPVHTAEYLRNIMADPQADPLLKQGILLGLLRTGGNSPHKVIEGLTFPEPESRDLALVLRARYGGALPPEDLKQLGLMVRGGSRQQSPLCIQGAWIYLKLTNQTGPALAEVLGH